MRPRKHILHVVLSLDVGGLENGVINLVNGLDRKRFLSTICCIKHAGQQATRLRDDVEVVELGYYGGYRIAGVARLARLMRERHVDVVHTRNLKPYLLSLLAARAVGVPLVLHSEHGRDYPFARHLMLAQRIGAALTDRYIALSGDLRDCLVKYIGIKPEKISVVRNGVDCERFAPRDKADAKKRLGYAPGHWVIGSVGRLVPVKNYPALVAAFARVSQAVPDARLCLVGDGPDRRRLETLVQQLGVSEKVRMLGSRSDVASIMNAMDVFALTSQNEGLSNTLLEAMASGIPVIASRAGGNAEVVVDGVVGALYPEGDTDALVRILLELNGNPERLAKLGENARLHAENRFSLAAMIASYESLYALA